MIGLCILSTFVPGFSETSAADPVGYSSDPCISDAGYSVSQPALFYYAKFIDLGFPFTGGKIGNDKPNYNMGLKFSENSIYANFSKLNLSETYKVTIQEFASETSESVTAELNATLPGESSNVFIWFSATAGDNCNKLYANGTEVASTITGSFTAGLGTHIYKIFLKKESGAIIQETTVKDLAHFTKITCISSFNYAESETSEKDFVQEYAKNYGFSRKASGESNYAATKIDGNGFGGYIFAIFLTNLDNPVIKVEDGSTHTATAAETHFWEDTSDVEQSTGYGCICIYEENLKTDGITNLDGYTISVGDGTNTYASEQYVAPKVIPEDSPSDNTTTIVIAAIAAFAIVVVIGIVIIRRGTN